MFPSAAALREERGGIPSGLGHRGRGATRCSPSHQAPRDASASPGVGKVHDGKRHAGRASAPPRGTPLKSEAQTSGRPDPSGGFGHRDRSGQFGAVAATKVSVRCRRCFGSHGPAWPLRRSRRTDRRSTSRAHRRPRAPVQRHSDREPFSARPLAAMPGCASGGVRVPKPNRSNPERKLRSNLWDGTDGLRTGAAPRRSPHAAASAAAAGRACAGRQAFRHLAGMGRAVTTRGHRPR